MKVIYRKLINNMRWHAKRFIAFFSNVFYRRTDSQIVICGFPRSGTSLLFNIVAGVLDEHKTYTGSVVVN